MKKQTINPVKAYYVECFHNDVFCVSLFTNIPYYTILELLHEEIVPLGILPSELTFKRSTAGYSETGVWLQDNGDILYEDMNEPECNYTIPCDEWSAKLSA